MAYKNRNSIKLFYQNIEVGTVLDAHNGLGWTSGVFVYETSNENIRNFLNEYRALEDLYGDEWEEELTKLREVYGDLVESELWRLVVQGTREEMKLAYVPFVSEDFDSITYKLDRSE